MTDFDIDLALTDPADACNPVDVKPVPGWPGAVAFNPDVALERLKVGRRDAVTDSGRIVLGPSLWPSRDVNRVRVLRWQWKVTDHLTGQLLASGYSLRERWACHRAQVVAGRIFTERKAVRVE